MAPHRFGPHLLLCVGDGWLNTRVDEQDRQRKWCFYCGRASCSYVGSLDWVYGLQVRCASDAVPSRPQTFMMGSLASTGREGVIMDEKSPSGGLAALKLGDDGPCALCS